MVILLQSLFPPRELILFLSLVSLTGTNSEGSYGLALTAATDTKVAGVAITLGTGKDLKHFLTKPTTTNP